jgi:tetratricopeptide (TPR) repeat protein
MKAAPVWAAAIVALASCSSLTSITQSGHVVELDDVPFFAQERYQCGPAALATLLVDSDVRITPEELVPAVYVPERKGSFQPELKAAARSYNRLPYEPDPSLETLFAEIDAGNPVLVLQNFWFDWFPKWHYAVVVGYDPQAQTVILRSGTQERRVEKLDAFVRSWSGGHNWALLTLRPDQIPATATPDRYIATIAQSEGRVPASTLTTALAAALEQWPANANVSFAVANNTRRQGDVSKAASLYRKSLALDPNHLGALNNYSDLLLSESCFAAAATQINKAQQTADPDSPLYATIIATANEIEAAKKGADHGVKCTELIGNQQR